MELGDENDEDNNEDLDGDNEDEEEEEEEEVEVDYDDDDEEEVDIISLPLIAAVCDGYLTTVQSLLKQGAVKNATYRGRTAIWYAAKNGHLAVVGCLSGQGADNDQANNEGVTPISIASEKNHLVILRWLEPTWTKQTTME